MNFSELVNQMIDQNELLYAVLSSPIDKSSKLTKITIRPIQLKRQRLFQVTETVGAQEKHQNMSAEACKKLLLQALPHEFKQLLVCTPHQDYHVLGNKKGEITLLKKPPTRQPISLKHNRTKHYLLQEGEKIPFLIELGVMNKEGKVLHDKRDKFRQLNRFLEMIQDILPALKKDKTLQIIDFGCGKAYLTFALYHFLHHIHGYDIHVTGLDLKKEVIEYCQSVAQQLHFKNLIFSVGDISHFQPQNKVDMVVTLHACDTATDAALEKAVRWDADVILSVPCCQHQLFNQIHSPTLEPLLQFGILKERFSALVTDAARAQLLQILGYETQVLEFIDLEHTPKNLLIRAVKGAKKGNAKQIKQYQDFKNFLNIYPTFEKFAL
jgi:SAM-dependent methyltransferase